MVRSYEELVGGLGRAIHFRTERYAARELLKRVRPVLRVEGEAFLLDDLSMNGLSFRQRSGPTANLWEPGKRVGVSLCLRDEVTYEGPCEVTRVEETHSGTKIALKLLSGFIDIPRLVAVHDRHALSEDLDGGVAGDVSRIAPEYRTLCADVVHLLRRYKDTMDRVESLRGDLAEDVERLEDTLRRCELRLTEEWNALRARANELVVDVPDDMRRLQAYKRYTEAVVTPEVLIAPNWRRCYEKPLGYPGDYVIMDFLYSGELRGDSAYARTMHRFGLEQPIAACVPLRMEMLERVIVETLHRFEHVAGPTYVASLGCGPAREVERVVARGNGGAPAHYTLIDQDDRALSYAYRRVFRALSEGSGPATAECFYVSFSQLLKNPALFGDMAQQHLIYSAGLFDYIGTRQAQHLIGRLFDKLTPRGRLLVGNMRAPTQGAWALEYVLDWPLIYRTEAEMMELATGANAAEVRLEQDPTGNTWLLHLTKGG